MTTNPTVWRHLPPARPVAPPSWDCEFTAPCPHGRDVTWVAAESVDERRSWAVPGCGPECPAASDPGADLLEVAS